MPKKTNMVIPKETDIPSKKSSKDLSKEELEKKVSELEKKLNLLETKQWSSYIDEYIDTWYEENKDDVDIGNIKLFGLFNVDVMPDELEKHIYKKVFKIMFSLLKHKL
tara:strand:- start:3506 stop:3829 length:324 start_codon:yes stop_codon:yes gene_type:complete